MAGITIGKIYAKAPANNTSDADLYKRQMLNTPLIWVRTERRCPSGRKKRPYI